MGEKDEVEDVIKHLHELCKMGRFYAPIVRYDPVGEIIKRIQEITESYRGEGKMETVKQLENIQCYFEKKYEELKHGIII